MAESPPNKKTIPNPARRTGKRSAAPPRHDPFDGILLVDKPTGMTSHDVVDRIRRGFRLRKVGHGGTLDPMATGLLVILIGRGTKLSQRIMGTDKTYEGAMHLGVATYTEDADGDVVAERDAGHVTREAVEAQMVQRRGDQMQTPPMVSAIKKDGVPLYKLARKGASVEREPRLIHIYRFVLTRFEPPRAYFTLTCTKGTYVRTLCADIGAALECGAHLSELRRTASGEFTIEQAHPLDRIMDWTLAELGEHVLPVHAFAKWTT